MNIAQDATQLVGNTPLVRINQLSNDTNTEILGKCEFMNPTSSVKDRIALAMIETAIKEGQIKKGTIVVEQGGNDDSVSRVTPRPARTRPRLRPRCPAALQR